MVALFDLFQSIRRSARPLPRAGEVVMVSNGGGQPNYGDERISLAVIAFHARQGCSTWVNSANASVSTGCFALAASIDAPRSIDFFWPPKTSYASMSAAIQSGLQVFENEFAGRPARHFVDAFATIATVHLAGGGYFNSMWPRTSFMMGVALAMKRKFGARLVATGLGLMPIDDADARALADAAAEFDGFECRDRPSAEALQRHGADVTAGVDDAFIDHCAAPAAAGARPDLHLCLQFSEWTPDRQDRNAERIATAIARLSAEIGEIFVWEFCPSSDLKLLDHPRLAFIRERAVVRRLEELLRYGVRAREGDLAIVSRFHAHQLFARAGVRGCVIVEGGASFVTDFYATKHDSLKECGSNWRHLLEAEDIHMSSFPPLPDWRRFNTVNQARKRAVFSQYF